MNRDSCKQFKHVLIRLTLFRLIKGSDISSDIKDLLNNVSMVVTTVWSIWSAITRGRYAHSIFLVLCLKQNMFEVTINCFCYLDENRLNSNTAQSGRREKENLTSGDSVTRTNP